MLILMGISQAKHFTATDRKFLATNASFRHLDPAQVAAIRAPRLHILPRGAQSFKALAQQSALEYEAVNILRLLNRSFPEGDINSLGQIKTVSLED
jgi:predicted Zn-dependent protease